MVEQIVCHHNGQHTVAQKFQPLVIQRRGFALVGVRAVGQRRDKQFFILKMVMQLFFQFLRGTRGHKIALPFVLSVLRLYIGIFCRPGGQCPPLQWALVLRLSRRGAHCAPAAYILVPAISNGRAQHFNFRTICRFIPRLSFLLRPWRLLRPGRSAWYRTGHWQRTALPGGWRS